MRFDTSSSLWNCCVRNVIFTVVWWLHRDVWWPGRQHSGTTRMWCMCSIIIMDIMSIETHHKRVRYVGGVGGWHGPHFFFIHSQEYGMKCIQNDRNQMGVFMGHYGKISGPLHTLFVVNILGASKPNLAVLLPTYRYRCFSCNLFKPRGTLFFASQVVNCGANVFLLVKDCRCDTKTAVESQSKMQKIQEQGVSVLTFHIVIVWHLLM